MKTKLIVTLLTMAFVALAPSFALADGGAPDSLFLLTSRPEVGVEEATMIVELWVYTDADVLGGVAVGFKWDSNLMTLDSAKAESAATTAWNQFFFVEGSSQTDMTIANANKRALFSGFGIFTPNLQVSPNRQHLATYYFSLSSWDVSSHLVLDSTAWDDGTEMLFTNTDFVGYTPVWYWGERGIHVQDPSDVGDENGLPNVYALAQNYPNPFNPETTISFSLEQAGDYTLTVYNVIGQVVQQWNDYGSAGPQEPVTFGQGKASGVYFYKLTSGSFTETKKMMLVK